MTRSFSDSELMSGVHVPGGVVGEALERANLDPSSETYVQDLASVVHDVGAAHIRNEFREAVTDLEGRFAQMLVETAIPQVEVDRLVDEYLRKGR